MIEFTDDEIISLAAPYQFMLVVSFWYRRPSMATIRSSVNRIRFIGSVRVGLLDSMHKLLHFAQETDYLRCFARQSWTIAGKYMRVTKWTPEFDQKVDVPIVPVWVSLPGLPIHFHQQDALFQIGRFLGTPMKLDAATAEVLRPSVARLCVEVDIS